MPVVAAQRRSPVTELEVRFDLKIGSRVVGRIELDEPLGVLQGVFLIATRRRFLGQADESSMSLALKPFALLEHPLVVARG